MPRSLTKRLETAAQGYCAAKSRAMDKLAAAAQAFAKAETLAYSAAHPRRTVTFCAAMGTTTLFVSAGATCDYRGAYHMSGDRSDIGEPPAFLATLDRVDMETEDGQGWLAGPLRFECKGGRVISDESEW